MLRVCVRRALYLLAMAGLFVSSPTVKAQSFSASPTFEQVFGCKSNAATQGVRAQIIKSNAAGNVFWPKEESTFEFQLVNETDQPIKAEGRWEVIQYATRGD